MKGHRYSVLALVFLLTCIQSSALKKMKRKNIETCIQSSGFIALYTSIDDQHFLSVESTGEIITPRKVVFLAFNIFEAVNVQKLHKYINSSQHFVCLEAKRCSRIRITYIKGLELDHRLENRCILRHIFNMNIQSWAIFGQSVLQRKKSKLL